MDAVIIFIAQYLYLLVVLVAVVFFFTRPNSEKKEIAVCGAIILPLSFILSRIGGSLYYDARPFVVGHFTPLIAHAADNGFPSDHMLLTGALAAVAWFYNRRLSVVLWVLALLIGWARVYSGIHHTTDIVGSIVIVLISAAVYRFTMRNTHARRA